MNTILKNITYHCPMLLSDKKYIEAYWEIRNGCALNLDNPMTFNEKMNYLKLYDHNPLYNKLVDKAEVKSYVRDILGSQILIPTLGVWDSFDNIDFDTLPDSGFVLKCTHDSGSILIVKDKHQFNRKEAGKIFKKALRHNFFWNSREWPYKNVRPRIIAEPFMADLEGNLNDYKFFCNYGKVKFLFVATNRFSTTSETRFDFFDRDYNHFDVTNGHPMADTTPERPEKFDEMISICEKLSEGIPFVRVDLYYVNGRILFGEYTFFHWGGFMVFNPFEWDRKFGEMIEL